MRNSPPPILTVYLMPISHAITQFVIEFLPIETMLLAEGFRHTMVMMVNLFFAHLTWLSTNALINVFNTSTTGLFSH